jgi:hypothetical protein
LANICIGAAKKTAIQSHISIAKKAIDHIQYIEQNPCDAQTRPFLPGNIAFPERAR